MLFFSLNVYYIEPTDQPTNHPSKPPPPTYSNSGTGGGGVQQQAPKASTPKQKVFMCSYVYTWKYIYVNDL